MRKTTTQLLVIITLALGCATACGQKGPLVLPEQDTLTHAAS